MRICNECPLTLQLMKIEEEGEDELMLAFQVVQGMSGSLVGVVKGTLGLTAERVEEIRQKQIKSWGDSEEARFLEAHPELGQASYECERRINIANECAIHSVRAATKAE